MAERLKAHAWRACVPKGTVGSNPTLSGLLVIMKIGAPEWFQVPWDSKGANTCSAQDSESERGGIPLSPVC